MGPVGCSAERQRGPDQYSHVLLDADLAEFYGVETKVLNQAVKRNLDRFPEDFMFQLTAEEWEGSGHRL